MLTLNDNYLCFLSNFETIGGSCEFCGAPCSDKLGSWGLMVPAAEMTDERGDKADSTANNCGWGRTKQQHDNAN